MAQNGAHYLGGLSWAPEPGYGDLTLNDQTIDVTRRRSKKDAGRLVVKVQVAAIDSVEITSEQAAKSKVGAVLLFGVFGLGAKGSMDRGVILVHMKSGQTGYFQVEGYSVHQLQAKLTPWLHSVKVRVGPPTVEAVPLVAPPMAAHSVADEIAKLGALKTQGLLTEEEFAAQKAKLLG
jgi:Short C-terminal domain